MKKSLLIVMMLLATLVGFSQIFQQKVDDIIQEVELDSLIFYVRNLSGEDSVFVDDEKVLIDHRVSNWGNDLSANYILETFTAFGLNAWIDEYSIFGKNVLALQEGVSSSEAYYIICAHYDAVDYYCADDNASGSAAVLEAARILRNYTFEHGILYALWDEEEIGLIGSGNYAQQAAVNGDEILGVINLDMIAWDGDNDKEVEIHSSLTANSDELSDYLAAFANLYALNLIPRIEIPGTGASDHARFWAQGYPAVLLIEEYFGGDFNPFYHSENDRFSLFNLPYFHENSKFAIGAIASLAGPFNITGLDMVKASTWKESVHIYPNPFGRETNLAYTLNNGEKIKITLINSYGLEVKTLFEGFQYKGAHKMTLSAGEMPAGSYWLIMQTAEDVLIRKLVKVQ